MEFIPLKSQNSLSIRIFSDGFSLYISDNNRALIGSRHIQRKNKTDLTLQDEFKKSPEFNLSYQCVKLYVETGYFSLIPGIFDDVSDQHNLLRLHHPDLNQNVVIYSTLLNKSKARFIYAVSAEWNQTCKSIFPDVTPQLHLTPIIAQHSDAAIVWIRKTEMDIAILTNGEPVLVNAYNYQSPEDLLYFTLNMLKELKINKKTFPIILYHSSELHPELLFKGFFTNVSAIPQMQWYENN